MHRKIITYAVDKDGMVVSRVGSEVAFPVLNYEGMKPENNFGLVYHLGKGSVHNLLPYWEELRWTKKIPVAVKNLHRAFWGMKPLPNKEGGN